LYTFKSSENFIKKIESNTFMAEKRDVSRATIVVLVILAVLISLISTWIVLVEVNQLSNAKTGKASATVKLNIQPAPEKPEPASATGNVVLNIKPRRELQNA